ncbi:hypothetical protein ACJMK2_023585 [Sinanodonta woodiana]|uniref:Transmembrane protein 198 n=1 Tax=Sinanodonta woodiana TaxID=1069815 RepID=A0ABD3T6D4_SINWO
MAVSSDTINHTNWDILNSSAGITYGIDGENTTATTTITTESKAVSDTCHTIDYDYDIATTVICSMCFIFGIIYTFFGYRFFKAVMFLTGFIFGSVLVYLICLEEKTLSMAAITGISLGAGVLCGLLTMLVQYLGLFLTGFNLGISFGMGVLISMELFYHPQTKWIPISILIGIGVIFALLTLKFQKSFTILGTSIFGGLLMISCLDFFIEKFLLMHYVWERVKGEYSDSLCWYSWIILGCWPFCFLVGSITQWKITGQGYHHQDVLHIKRAKKATIQRSRSKEKRDTQHSRYRHLYQIRRYNGDVISQNYVYSEQPKMSPALRTLTPIPTDPQGDLQLELESANTTLTQLA